MIDDRLRQSVWRREVSMIRIVRFLPLIASVIMLLTNTPSWGQPVCVAPGCNPTVSDNVGNTAGGTGALGSVTGAHNTAFGFVALGSNTTGDSNTAVGINALAGNETGSDNTAIGNAALVSNSIGNANTAFGGGALASNTIGVSNTASGLSALGLNQSGNLNSALGLEALGNNNAGNDNTAIGAKALKKSQGTKNIGIGYQAGVTLTNGNNNIYIGNPGAGDESQTIRIGTAQAQTFIAGINTAGVSGTAVVVDANGQLGITLSSARYKKDIETMANRSEGLLKLRPVTFVYKDDASAAPRYGLIAEEVATVYPELVTRTATGDVQTVKYHELIPMLLNELQREHQNVATLKQELAELATLRKELAELRSLVGSRLGQ
jgi:hypothetical protein